MVDCVKAHLAALELLGIRKVPKHHLLVHWATRSSQVGNPDKYSTYADEHLNGGLAKIGAKAHARGWSRRVITEFRQAYSSDPPFRKRART